MNAPARASGTSTPSNVLRLPHRPHEVGPARRRVRAELATIVPSSTVLDDVDIVVSELLGNAVRYARPIAGGVLLVGWRVTDGEIQVRVTDGGSGRKVEPRDASAMADSGRGLRIVEELTTAWGVSEHVGGLRTVWAALPIHRPGPSLRLVR